MSSFEPNKLIKECIEKKDIARLRGMVTGILVRDRNSSTGDFENNIDYIINKCGIKELFEKFDESKPLVRDVSKDRDLSDEDFSDAIYYLKNNFCQERIEDVKSIGRELYPIIVDEFNEKEETLKKLNKNRKVKIFFLTLLIIIILVIVVTVIKIKR